MKTYAEFRASRKSIPNFLEVGDEVEEAIVDYAMDICPPAYLSHNIRQIGEPNEIIDGKPTFGTFSRFSDGNWKWNGYCHYAKTEEPKATSTEIAS